MFIYQKPNWPNFYWDSFSTNALLIKVRHRQGRILGLMEALGFPVQEQTALSTLTFDVIKSSEIEGEVLNRDQVRSSIARRLGIDIGGLVKAERNVEGVVEMMLDATQRYDEALSEERLKGWHSALFPTGYSGVNKIRVAQWREDKMTVESGPMGPETVHFEAPAAEKMDAEMKKFLDWLNSGPEMDPVLKAAIAHIWFLTIHPFDDGNGRIARAITDMLLARADKSKQRFYSMSAQIMLARQSYYEILEKTQRGSLDVTEWIMWFLECLYLSLESSEETISKAIARGRFWETHRESDFNARQSKILKLLLDDFFGKLTVSKYAKIAKVSTDTALRDLKDLVEKRILEIDGVGKGTSYRLIADK